MQDHGNGIVPSARVVTLLESIDRRLQVALRTQQETNVAPINPHQAYTRKQAARLLGVSTWSIDRARKQGLLIETRRIGERDVRITGVSLMAYMQEREATSVRVRTL